METGRVIGEVWATKQARSTAGLRWLLVQSEGAKESPQTGLTVVADTLDAGVGDRVVIVHGHAARISTDHFNTSIDCATIGVIDRQESEEELLEKAHMYEKMAEEADAG